MAEYHPITIDECQRQIRILKSSILSYCPANERKIEYLQAEIQKIKKLKLKEPVSAIKKLFHKEDK